MKIHCNLRGRWRLDRPEESRAKRASEGLVDREAVTIASRILTSTFLATISAAFPLGARIKGTRPEKVVNIRKIRFIQHTKGSYNTEQPVSHSFDLLLDLLFV